eukprot:Partr_v1_DN23676_c0_g1_i5_m18930 putative NA
MSKLSFTILALISFVIVIDAAPRFDQQNGEICTAIEEIRPIDTSFIEPMTNALLAATDACKQAQVADDIVKRANGDGKIIDIARKFMHCEKNFNNFESGEAANFCEDASLPKSEELKGILPLVDGVLNGAAEYNEIAKKSFESSINGNGNDTNATNNNGGCNAAASPPSSGNAGSGSILDRVQATGFNDCENCDGFNPDTTGGGKEGDDKARAEEEKRRAEN